jgi:hypothetical protein
MKAQAKAFRNGELADFSACEARFPARFVAIENRAGAGVCPSEGDVASIGALIEAGVADLTTLAAGGVLPPRDAGVGPDQLPASGQSVSHRARDDGAVRAGASLSYVDNGDGTITDVNTGLTWEKLSDDGTIHDRDNVYSWNDAFDVKIAALNSTSFAGYSDWRLPNVKELQSIIAYSMESAIGRPSVDPIFDEACRAGCSVSACSCTANDVPAFFWTSTTFAPDPSQAWVVYFNAGDVYEQLKFAPKFVRAVRGGS